MKQWKWIIVCLAALLLVGCANADIQADEQEKGSWQMNETMIEMIKEAVGCNDSRAKVILEILQEVQVSEPVSAAPVESGSNSIVVETADGGKYEIGINKKHYVYSIKDLSVGDYIYMVME